MSREAEILRNLESNRLRFQEQKDEVRKNRATKAYSRRKKKKNLTNFTDTTTLATAEKALNSWLDKRLSLGNAPRTKEIIEYALREKLGLTRSQIRKTVRLHPSYHMSSHQQREKLSSRKDRLILTNSLGQLHCDIGFFPIVRQYETPKTFRHGFLVARDVLSRYVYLQLLGNAKTTKTLIGVFEKILNHHKKVHPDYPVISISFDREPAIASKEMGRYLAQNHIKRYLFKVSRSKAKIAENAIRIVRNKVERLMVNNPRRRWWNLLPDVARDMNAEEIVIEGRKTGFAPEEINTSNLKTFLKRVKTLVPSYYFAQFRIPPPLIKYKFQLGDIVRPKSILASSEVIGVKRSQQNLESQTYTVTSYQPFVTKDLQARPGYLCVDTTYGDREWFAEQDIALSYLPKGEQEEESQPK